MEEQVGSSTLTLHVALTTSLVRVRGLVRAGIGEQEPEMQAALARVVALNEKLRAAEHDVSRTLQAQLGLSNNEMSVLWHLIAFAVEPQMKVLSAAATDESRPTVDAIRRCVYGEALTRDATRELGPRGMLRRLRLVEAQQPDAFTSVLTVSTRVLNWMCGDESLDDELDGIVSLPEPVERHPTDAQALNEVASAGSGNCVVVVTGAIGTGRRTHILAAARPQLGILEIDGTALPKDARAFVRCLKSVARECRLLARRPLVRNIDALVDGNDQSRVDLIGSELVPEIEGLVFVTCGPNRPAMRWGRPTIVVDVKPPTSAQRAQLWLRELGQGTQEDAEYLATQYPLAPALIHHAASAAKARANGRALQPDDIYQGIRAVLDDKLGDYAKRVEVTQSWADLVLPDDQREAIDYLIARIRQRRTVYEQWGFAAKVGKGLGTSALFSGPPGTGKTMVAALVAKELGLELYQVDMAKLVSKFIGETERNLAALFDAAEAGHAILLFDEADSLFGKRTDVKSSNDRYANLETNYLLQRLESFTGICLLTSNHESNIDPAFQRRLSLHLRFELPDVDERAALWRAMLPAAAPVAPNLDVQGLARRFAMSGGYIRNAALRAAFLAADEGSAITAAHLERAARLEYEGMGKLAA